MEPDVTLLGKLASVIAPITADQSQPDIGSIEIALCGYGPMTPRVRGEAVFSNITVIDLMNPSSDIAAGSFEFSLYSNGVIYPPGTYYTLTVKNQNGDIVQCEAYYFAPGEYYFHDLTPFDPNQPPPPLPAPVQNLLLIVPYSYSAEFPGDVFTSWQITLEGDVSPSFTNLEDGNLYTIIIIQDANGNHAFHWPSNANNTTPVNTDANGMTVQTFVAVANNLYPIGAGTYYP